MLKCTQRKCQNSEPYATIRNWWVEETLVRSKITVGTVKYVSSTRGVVKTWDIFPNQRFTVQMTSLPAKQFRAILKVPMLYTTIEKATTYNKEKWNKVWK